jgi:hypothetical protein
MKNVILLCAIVFYLIWGCFYLYMYFWYKDMREGYSIMRDHHYKMKYIYENKCK